MELDVTVKNASPRFANNVSGASFQIVDLLAHNIMSTSVKEKEEKSVCLQCITHSTVLSLRQYFYLLLLLLLTLISGRCLVLKKQNKIRGFYFTQFTAEYTSM